LFLIYGDDDKVVILKFICKVIFISKSNLLYTRGECDKYEEN